MFTRLTILVLVVLVAIAGGAAAFNRSAEVSQGREAGAIIGGMIGR